MNGYRVLREDEHGFWTDLPGAIDVPDVEHAKEIAALAAHSGPDRQHTRVVNAHSAVLYDSEWTSEVPVVA